MNNAHPQPARDIFGDAGATARLAPGYLYLEGLFRLAPALERAEVVRLLISNPTHHETLEQIARRAHRLDPARAAAEARRYLSRPDANKVVAAAVAGFRGCLETMDQTEANQSAGRRVLDLLDRKRLAVRLHVNGSFGTRMYLFDHGARRAAHAGSANLLLPGGLDPTDHLVVVADENESARLTRHFDSLWDDAADVSDRLAEVIRASWGHSLASPYDVYMKTLYTLVHERVEFDAGEALLDEDVFGQLAEFQRDAFRQAVQILREYRGVFISDVVGLGKSFIGAAVVKHFEQARRARALILCPAPLVEMWQRYNEAHRLNAQVLSTGMLRRGEGGNVLLDDVRYRDRDFVLIDESHAFRNPGTQRYAALSDFLSRGGRQACLLTATPRNRSAWDIYHQIKLFHPEDRTDLPIDPPNLRDYFRAVEKGQRSLPNLLSHLLIRRTRNHVLRYYGHDAETRQPVDRDRFEPYRDGRRRAYVLVADRRQFFPRRELETIEYSIEQTYQGLYAQLRGYLTPGPPEGRLLFARYGLYGYVREDRRSQEPYAQLRTTSASLHGLVRVLLFKRFESSVEAFRKSVGRMIETHRAFLAALENGIVPAGEDAQTLLREFGEWGEEEAMEALRAASGRYALEDFDQGRMLRDVRHDVGVLERILALVEPITPDRDKKLAVLRERLAAAPLHEGKRLIFTQFADTARYLFEQLRGGDRPGARVALMLGGGRDKGAVLGRFAPRANPEHAPRDPGDQIATLVTTDVMAEGLNLQDCDKIVNYDLHWNPVRLIQRFGRIDRIGSEHEQIFGFNFLPEAELERNLGLRQILTQRIREIHETIGEDASILEAGERLNEEAMYAIYQPAEGGGLDRLEEEPDAASVHLAEAEKELRLLRHNDPEEYARIAALPDGLRSAKKASADGLFVFSQAGAYRELVLLDDAGHLVCDDVPRVLGLLKCRRNTPTAEFPSGLVPLMVHTQRRFAERAAERRAELGHAPSVSLGQRYVLRQLRDLAEAGDPRVERLEQAYRHPLPQAVTRQLTRLRSERVEGQALLGALTSLYHDHGLGERRPAEGERESAEAMPRLICSEALVKPQ